MPKCPCCEDGWVYRDEDGRQVRDACYHCGNTGVISDEQARVDRIQHAASEVAREVVGSMIRAANNPENEGEGWAFLAAENMMHETDYTQAQVMTWGDRVMRVFQQLDTTEPTILAAIVDFVLDEEGWRSAASPNPNNLDGWTGSCLTGVEADKPLFQRVNEAVVADIKSQQSSKHTGDNIPF